MTKGAARQKRLRNTDLDCTHCNGEGIEKIKSYPIKLIRLFPVISLLFIYPSSVKDVMWLTIISCSLNLYFTFSRIKFERELIQHNESSKWGQFFPGTLFIFTILTICDMGSISSTFVCANMIRGIFRYAAFGKGHTNLSIFIPVWGWFNVSECWWNWTVNFSLLLCVRKFWLYEQSLVKST